MKCPYCGNEDTEVVDSREVPNESSIRRRRECTECKRRFTTYEKSDFAGVTVIKRNNTRESFNRDKILAGIMRACEKRKISREAMDRVVDKIDAKINGNDIKEIKSSAIGDMVIRELFKLDPVAYIRFASVYKNFDSPSEFKEVVKLFEESKNKGKKPVKKKSKKK